MKTRRWRFVDIDVDLTTKPDLTNSGGQLNSKHGHPCTRDRFVLFIVDSVSGLAPQGVQVAISSYLLKNYQGNYFGYQQTSARSCPLTL